MYFIKIYLGVNLMYEYKIEKSKVDEAEIVMNEYAKENWRVVAVSPNIARGYGVIITLEREKR